MLYKDFDDAKRSKQFKVDSSKDEEKQFIIVYYLLKESLKSLQWFDLKRVKFTKSLINFLSGFTSLENIYFSIVIDYQRL